MTAPNPWHVRRWMSSNVHTTEPKADLVDAFEIMRTHRVRHVPVLDGGRLVGIVSDRDVRHALPMRSGTGDHDIYGKALFETRVEQVMTRRPLTVTPDTTIREAAEIACREKVGALPVLEGEKLVGIVSAEDLLWAYVDLVPDDPS